VLRSLEGETEALKERLIGMTVLGREASYDTSTDAGVRVRANDVRKRLNAYNKVLGSAADFCFGLPAGTYVPVFYRSVAEVQASEPVSAEAPALGLSLYRLATPTLVALFLCVICMRWEFAQAHSFLRFWNRVLPDDRAQLYLQPPRADGSQDMAIRELRFAAPLFDLAGQLHHRFTVVGTPGQSVAAEGMLVYVGAVAGSMGQPDTLSGLPEAAAAGAASRFVVEDTPAGRRIVDRESFGSGMAGGALLTIVNGPRLLIWIDGTDDTAIRMLLDRLCDQSAFPATLADNFQTDTITQAVFPTYSRGDPTIFRMPLRRLQAGLEP
jgi:hypothetical protein